MNTLMKTRLPALILSTVLATSATFADCDQARNTKGLTDTAEAVIVYDRIRAAARRACSNAMSPWDGRKIKTRNRCVEVAVDEAVALYDQPLLTAVHRASVEGMASL